MHKKPPSSLCSGAAIAAALALGSTVASAQDAAVTAPPVAPPAAVTTSVPAAQPATISVMTQTPVVQAVPASPAPEPAPAAQSRTGAATQPRQAASRAVTPRAAPAAPAAVTPPRVPTTVAAPLPAAVPPVAAVPAAPITAPAPVPATVAAPAEDGLTGAEVGLLGLLAAAALGGAALIVARLRRPAASEPDMIEVQPAVEAVPVAAAIPAALAEYSVPSPERFVMPAGSVPTGDARNELLKRMVAAPPDEANPFVSRKRRLHRARVLLAERESQLRDRSTEPFDWRTYRPTRANASQHTEVPEFVHDPT